jgi:hypothetical protein
MIKNNAEKAPIRTSTTTSNPTTYSTVYLRIQPYLTSIPPLSTSGPSDPPSSDPPAVPQSTHLQFILHLTSPSHALTHTTTTQAVPLRWVDAFQAEDADGQGGQVNSWVEDVLVDVLRVGIEVIGQEYVGERMGWGKRAETVALGDAAKADGAPEKGNAEEPPLKAKD